MNSPASCVICKLRTNCMSFQQRKKWLPVMSIKLYLRQIKFISFWQTENRILQNTATMYYSTLPFSIFLFTTTRGLSTILILVVYRTHDTSIHQVISPSSQVSLQFRASEFLACVQTSPISFASRGSFHFYWSSDDGLRGIFTGNDLPYFRCETSNFWLFFPHKTWFAKKPWAVIAIIINCYVRIEFSMSWNVTL